MKDELLSRINKLNRFDLDENEYGRYYIDDIKNKVKEFRKNLYLYDYMPLFEDINEYLKNGDENKEEVIRETCELIRNYSEFYEKVEELPKIVKNVYNSYIRFKELNVIYENVNCLPVCTPIQYGEIVSFYHNFLEAPENDFFCNNYKTEIYKFTNSLLVYLNKKEENKLYKSLISESLKEELKEIRCKSI